MGHIGLEELNREDVQAVEAVLEACEDFFVMTTGSPASAAAAEALFTEIPDGVTRADKHILGISDLDTREMLGVIDAIVGYPNTTTVSVGLFLVIPGLRRPRAEADARERLEAWAAARGASSVRVTVHDISFASLSHWQDACYEAAGSPAREGRSLAVVFEKRLDGPPSSPAPAPYDCLTGLGPQDAM